jgi:hypothetical protein
MSSKLEQQQKDVLKNVDLILAHKVNLLKEQGKSLTDNSADIIDKTLSDKNKNMEKLIGDLDRSIDSHRSIYDYYQRNKDLLDISADPAERLRQEAEGLMYDKNNAQRQYEINQWTSGNRQDTLFVYQLIFLSSLLLAFFVGLWRMGLIGTGFIGLLATVLIIIIVLVIFKRGYYTSYLRNKRYWNKREFPKFAGPQIPTPDCPAALDSISGVYNKTLTSVADAPNKFIGTLQSGLSSIGGAANAASSRLGGLRV